MLVVLSLGGSLGVAGCGGDDDGESRRGAAAARPVVGLTQQQALGFTTGTPRDALVRRAGRPLPIRRYALTAQERRDCVYYPLRASRVQYDNVWRFCFRDQRLLSVSTAPRKDLAGPDAAEPPAKKPRDDFKTYGTPGDGGSG